MNNEQILELWRTNNTYRKQTKFTNELVIRNIKCLATL